jgi:hypothetical protein
VKVSVVVIFVLVARMELGICNVTMERRSRGFYMPGEASKKDGGALMARGGVPRCIGKMQQGGDVTSAIARGIGDVLN